MPFLVYLIPLQTLNVPPFTLTYQFLSFCFDNCEVEVPQSVFSQLLSNSRTAGMNVGYTCTIILNGARNYLVAPRQTGIEWLVFAELNLSSTQTAYWEERMAVLTPEPCLNSRRMLVGEG